MRQCQVSGCSRPAASRYTRHCAGHKARLRRHGAIDQPAISKADLAPFVKAVESRIEKNRNSPVWVALQDRWRAVADHAKGVIAAAQAGRAGSRYERQAALEAAKIAGEIPARAVVETALAVIVMWKLEPRRFRADAALYSQLTRRVRALTDMNFGESYRHSTGKVKRYYKELSPRSAAIFGGWLVEALGVAGLKIAERIKADEDAAVEAKQAFNKALSEVR